MNDVQEQEKDACEVGEPEGRIEVTGENLDYETPVEKLKETLDKSTDIAMDMAAGLTPKKEGVITNITEPEPEEEIPERTLKVLDELNQRIAEAEKSGSFFITITRKEDERLSHWHGMINFPREDCAHSLRELLKMAPKPPDVSGKVRRFGSGR